MSVDNIISADGGSLKAERFNRLLPPPNILVRRSNKPDGDNASSVSDLPAAAGSLNNNNNNNNNNLPPHTPNPHEQPPPQPHPAPTLASNPSHWL